MEIQSKRLVMIPLKGDELLHYMEGDTDYIINTSIKCQGISISPQLKKAIRDDILPWVKIKPENYEFHTLWLIIKKAEKALVGEFCLKGIHHNNASIEIGYGIHPEYQNQGYMKEALSAICPFLLTQKNIKKIIAYTSEDNIASIRTLQENGFIKTNKKIKGDELLSFIKE